MPGRKRSRRKDARPEEIVAAALQVFAQKGYSATSLGDIAARADISRTTVYLYFPDKEAIIRQAFEDRLGTVLKSTHAQLMEMDAPFEQVFARLLDRLYDRVTEPETLVILKVLIAEGNQLPELVRFYHESILRNAKDMLGALIRRGVNRGELRADAMQFDVKLVIAPIIVAAVWQLTFSDLEDIDLPGFIKGHAEMVLNGLRAPGGLPV